MNIEELYDRAVNEFEDIIFLGNLNARNSQFWYDEVTNAEGPILHTICIKLRFTELIHEPTRMSTTQNPA